jgi:methionyl-tRNA synthetase
MIGKRIVVTSALPYSNGEIHLGHIVSTYLPSDIFVRFLRLNKADVVFVCGGDDYGTPILIRAEEEGKDPEEYVEYWHAQHKKDFADLGISFDIYYKTHSKENIRLVQHFFRVLNQKGLIFAEEIEQYYCERDGKFLPDRYLRVTCPFCDATDQYGDSCERCGKTYSPLEVKDPKCAICGGKPTLRKSLHYFFKLSAFADELESWLRSNENLQEEVKNYVLGWIREGLRDWDITRDITWGVRIPLKEARGKVLYGWFDNHLGYISFTFKHLRDKGIDGRDFWNSSTIYHFIGKDIVYHHFLFLPAMRLAEGSFKLPDFIPVRGHLLLQGKKFSKSRGWYISLREFLEVFPADYLRFYLALITPYSQQDVNFDWEDFRARINNELVANLGNFVHRTMSFIWGFFDGRVPRPLEGDEDYKRLEARIKGIAKEVGDEIARNELSKALKEILRFSNSCNAYFQKKEPWRTKDPSALFICANAVRSLAILLAPFIPFSAQKLWRQLNLKGSVHEQEWKSASKILLRPGHVINKPEIPFKRVEDREIRREVRKLKARAQQV